jgi:peptidoglycan/LPS O-acetylase OafA/YrhL
MRKPMAFGIDQCRTEQTVSIFSHIRLGSEKYPSLTGIRALGATVIFFDHFPISPDAHNTLNVMAFFFTLSGFLIVRIYYEQVKFRADWLTKYFVNRFARIYPVYFLLLSIALCLHPGFRPWTVVANYTLTHALFHGTELIIEPSWSLTVEECFYLLAPCFMILAKRSNFWLPFAVGWILLSAALLISKLGIAFLGTPGFVLSITFFGHFVEFFAGFYLALALMRLEKRGSIGASGGKRTAAGVAGVSLLVFAMAVVYRQSPRHWYVMVILINNFLIPFPIALLYWGLLREKTLLSRLLSNHLSGLLGRSSYSFYLLHTLVINYLAIPLLLPRIGSRLLCVLITLIVTWSASALLFVFYEEPINIFIRRMFRSKEATVGMLATLFQVKPR